MDHKDEGVRKLTTFKWLRIKASGEICENSNEYEVFINETMSEGLKAFQGKVFQVSLSAIRNSDYSNTRLKTLI